MSLDSNSLLQEIVYNKATAKLKSQKIIILSTDLEASAPYSESSIGQICNIGAVMFDLVSGEVLDTFERNLKSTYNSGTKKFFISQGLFEYFQGIPSEKHLNPPKPVEQKEGWRDYDAFRKKAAAEAAKEGAIFLDLTDTASFDNAIVSNELQKHGLGIPFYEVGEGSPDNTMPIDSTQFGLALKTIYEGKIPSSHWGVLKSVGIKTKEAPHIGVEDAKIIATEFRDLCIKLLAEGEIKSILSNFAATHEAEFNSLLGKIVKEYSSEEATDSLVEATGEAPELAKEEAA